MGIRKNPKRDRLLTKCRKLAQAHQGKIIDPGLLFARANIDDLGNYTAEMLVNAAKIAHEDLNAWVPGKPKISIVADNAINPDGHGASILSITMRNMPFLFDSVMGEISANFRTIHLAIHPILLLSDGEPIRLSTTKDKDNSKNRVSYIQIHLPALNPDEQETLIANIKNVLDKVVLTVSDWKPMLTKLDDAIEGLKTQHKIQKKQDHEDALAFLDWLRADNFTFLGIREYTYTSDKKAGKVEQAKDKGLGILSDPDVRVLRFGKETVTTTPEIIEFLEGPKDIIVTKANVKSVVHRRAYMDYIGIKLFNKNGSVAGELRIVGLFTSTAYTQPAESIPLLRSKLNRVTGHFGYDRESHSGKALINTLESYPRDDLFQIDPDLLIGFCEQIMELGERPRVRVLPRIDHFDRFVSLMVYVPRDQYDSTVRERIGDYFKDIYQGRLSAYYPAFPEGGVARVHFIIGRSEGKTPEIPQAELEQRVREIATSWDDRFRALAKNADCTLETDRAFQAAFTPKKAFDDFEKIEEAATTTIAIDFYKQEGETGRLGLKIFHAEKPLSLSRRVPLLENIGFRVISEKTFEIAFSKEDMHRAIVVHDMELDITGADIPDFNAEKTRLEDAFLAAFFGRSDDDGFNRLVLTAGLTYREVTVLRAYARYLRQAGITYSQGYLYNTLNKYADIAADLFALFKTRLDPARTQKTRAKGEAEMTEQIEEKLKAVPSLDEDTILRRYINVIGATLRTNYFQHDEDGKPRDTLAFKLDPKAVEELPSPHPFREIFVYGADVEGIHLRFGKVARGGLRWSDRAQDYRTEVLGLVKAQQVKNAVIVPVGAKGGFFPKKLPIGGTREAIFEAGKSAYKTFIRTLLTVTDNIVGNETVAPGKTVRHDGDDPYFVVAADKGTATFSDTANAIAQDNNFWLDDAFASGGSAGYDHKKMGITARGAWEAVKRHFREMDIDIQSTPFTVAGVGDMSGDVFGNGMLLSRKIRLIAAFDHRDIFIDPDPDITTSYAERQRMFGLARSSWQDYDQSKLSTGGMIISRKEKSVRLTKEAATAIGLAKTTATPFEIMTAILKADIDLLWFGGIGTYIRAADETNGEVGDRANDPIRIVAAEVGAKVIGEGANLGVTQKGRIAFGLKGGRCNSDAIDNSAGVNSSDVEVNIKIALANAMRDERLTRERRNKLLTAMTEDVGELVLRNNYLQTLAITLCARKGIQNSAELSRLMNRLEADGHLDRDVENLPDPQTFNDRYASGHPLTRAEIGVLLSYAKIVLFDDLLESALPDDPWFEPLLMSYFPGGMKKNHEKDIKSHKLRREIIATLLSNHVINRGGPAFIATMTDAAGEKPAEIVKAAIIVRDGFNLPALWKEIDALDNLIATDIQTTLYEKTVQLYQASTHLILKTKLFDHDLGEAITRLQKAVRSLKSRWHDILPDYLADKIETTTAQLTEAGVPEALAREIAVLETLVLIPEIVVIAEETGDRLERVADVFIGVSDAFFINRMMEGADQLQPSDQYEAQALAQGIDDIATARRAITKAVLESGKTPKGALLKWSESHHDIVDNTTSKLSVLYESGDMTLSKVVVASGLLKTLALESVN